MREFTITNRIEFLLEFWLVFQPASLLARLAAGGPRRAIIVIAAASASARLYRRITVMYRLVRTRRTSLRSSCPAHRKRAFYRHFRYLLDQRLKLPDLDVTSRDLQAPTTPEQPQQEHAHQEAASRRRSREAADRRRVSLVGLLRSEVGVRHGALSEWLGLLPSLPERNALLEEALEQKVATPEDGLAYLRASFLWRSDIDCLVGGVRRDPQEAWVAQWVAVVPRMVAACSVKLDAGTFAHTLRALSLPPSTWERRERKQQEQTRRSRQERQRPNPKEKRKRATLMRTRGQLRGQLPRVVDAAYGQSILQVMQALGVAPNRGVMRTHSFSCVVLP